jgi:hypothetical protein
VDPFAWQEGHKPLLPHDFLKETIATYGHHQLSSNQDGRMFVSKCMNILDPLLPSNNLGRSINRANYLRIRKVFEHGAQQLMLIMNQVRALLHTSDDLAGVPSRVPQA